MGGFWMSASFSFWPGQGGWKGGGGLIIFIMETLWGGKGVGKGGYGDERVSWVCGCVEAGGGGAYAEGWVGSGGVRGGEDVLGGGKFDCVNVRIGMVTFSIAPGLTGLA